MGYRRLRRGHLYQRRLVSGYPSADGQGDHGHQHKGGVMSRFIEENVVAIIVGIHIVATVCLGIVVADAKKIVQGLGQAVFKFLKSPDQLKKG